MYREIIYILWLLLLAYPFYLLNAQQNQEYTFSVISQRSAIETAKTWNPILNYVEKITGIKLVLQVAKTGVESKEATDAGKYDFTYSNVIFDRPHIIYTPILKPNTDGISSQIVVLENSNIKNVQDLNNIKIGFPSKIAFTGYIIPTGYLNQQKILFEEVFGGNQEGIMAQLQSGAVQAAAVNSGVMKAYAQKENLKYKVIWESIKFPDIPISAHERVPLDITKSVQIAIASMSRETEGKEILSQIKEDTQREAPEFSMANMQTYEQYLLFYRKLQ